MRQPPPAKIIVLRGQSSSKRAAGADPESQDKDQAQKAEDKKLPRTLVLLCAFAEQHHVPLEAAGRVSKASKIAVVRGRWLINSRFATEALGARGQQDFYVVFHEREGFLPCDRCPHQISVKTGEAW